MSAELKTCGDDNNATGEMPLCSSSSSSSSSYRLLLRGASQLVQVARQRERCKTGKDTDDVAVFTDEDGVGGGGGYSMIVGHDGRIVAIGPDADIDTQFPQATTHFEQVLDLQSENENESESESESERRGDTSKSKKGAAGGKRQRRRRFCVVPGLCDGHTHPVWAGDRCHEFKMKLAGATYMEIHQAGGGIGFTVQHTRRASEDELFGLLINRLDRMLKQGTTLVEVKSGYGLNTETEIKMLKVIARAQKEHALDLVANFCGAHSVPKGMNVDEATRNVIEEQLPEVIKLKNEGVINPEMIDVFCEKGVFEAKESEAILRAGTEAGLLINFHGDELHPTGSAEMAAKLGATAVSHLEHVSDEGISAMAKAGVVGVLLPTTAYVLRIEPPPARKLIEGNVPVALGTDFNPNAHCMSLPFVMNLACVTMKMTVNEALVASTLNAAASMGKSQDYGSLEVGKMADFVIIEAPSWEHLVYQLVDPPISSVWKSGRCVFTKLS